MDKKYDPTLSYLQERHFKDKDRSKVNGWRKIFHENCNYKKVTVVILISEVVSETKNVDSDKEGHFIRIKLNS